MLRESAQLRSAALEFNGAAIHEVERRKGRQKRNGTGGASQAVRPDDRRTRKNDQNGPSDRKPRGRIASCLTPSPTCPAPGLRPAAPPPSSGSWPRVGAARPHLLKP